MGRAKHHWMEQQERGMSSVPAKQICSHHFRDKFITAFIRKNYTNGYCSYCQKEMKVVELEELMGFIMDGITKFYEDAGNFMNYNGREGGYLGSIYSPDELIFECDISAEPYKVIEDIVSSMDDIAWANQDAHYSDTAGDQLNYLWRRFKLIIKHETRYLFSTNSGDTGASTILKKVGKLISDLGIVKTIPKGQLLYRCRQHNYKTKFTSFDDLTAPANEDAIYPNRFSPSGIAMFYCAYDEQTAISETISRTDKKKNYISIAQFETLEDMIVVDFSRLPSIPSIFGVKDKTKYYLNMFLHDLVHDITKPIVKDGKEHTEYVPTQVVTEYLKFPFNKNRKHKISGMVYPSSKTANTNAAVFFWDKKSSKNFLKLNSISRSKIEKKVSANFLSSNKLF